MKSYRQVVLALVTVLFSVSVFGFSLERYVEGVHYSRIANPEPAPGTVVELFSFGCPHCANLEPALEQWLQKKPDNVTFSRVPATWNARFEFLARIHYVMQALDIEDKAAQALFDHIHKESRPLQSVDDVAAFMAGQGVKRVDFDAAWKDEARNEQVAAAGALFTRHQVSGVPAMLVNGQYSISVSQAGSTTEVFEVVNFLLKK